MIEGTGTSSHLIIVALIVFQMCFLNIVRRLLYFRRHNLIEGALKRLGGFVSLEFARLLTRESGRRQVGGEANTCEGGVIICATGLTSVRDAGRFTGAGRSGLKCMPGGCIVALPPQVAFPNGATYQRA